jgi:hypothetical protein
MENRWGRPGGRRRSFDHFFRESDGFCSGYRRPFGTRNLRVGDRGRARLLIRACAALAHAPVNAPPAHGAEFVTVFVYVVARWAF